MKASELKLLILEKLCDFNEFRPSKDSWCSAMSILRELQVSDMEFARSVVQSLIEDGLINHRAGQKLENGQFELLVQPNTKGVEFFDTEKQRRARLALDSDTHGTLSSNAAQQNSTNLLNRPIGNIGVNLFVGILVALAIYLIKTNFGIPL